jgi:hypothetical protein
LAGTDTVSVVCGGVEAFRFINDQALAMPGANATPAYSFAGDANTGINSDTADELDIVCGGNVIATASATGVSVAGTLSATNLLLSGVQPLTAGISPTTGRFWTDFYGRIEASGFTATVASGGAVTISSGPFGAAQVSTSASGDRAVVSLEQTVALTNVTLFTNTFRVTPQTLSNGTARYYLMVGLFNNTADTITATTGGGAWFQYDDATSAQWQCVTRNGATKQTTTTAVTVTATTHVKLTVQANPNSGGTMFYIDDVLVATHSTTTGLGSASIWGAIIERTISGSGTRSLLVDSFESVVTGTRT